MTFLEFFKQHNLPTPVSITKDYTKFFTTWIKDVSDKTIPKALQTENLLGYWTEENGTLYCFAKTKKVRVFDIIQNKDELCIKVGSNSWYDIKFQHESDAAAVLQYFVSKAPLIDGNEYMRIYHDIPVGGFKYDESRPIIPGQIWIPTRKNLPPYKVEEIYYNKIVNKLYVHLRHLDNPTTVTCGPLAQIQYDELNGKMYVLQQ